MDNLKRLVAIFGQSKVEGKTQDELIDMLINEYILLGGKNLKPVLEILKIKLPDNFDTRLFKREWIEAMSNKNAIEYIGEMDSANGPDYKGGIVIFVEAPRHRELIENSLRQDRGIIITSVSDNREAYSMKKTYLRNKLLLASYLSKATLSSITNFKDNKDAMDYIPVIDFYPIVTDINKSVNPSERKYQNRSKKQKRKK